MWKNDLGVGDWYLQEKECRIRAIQENTSYIFRSKVFRRIVFVRKTEVKHQK